MSGQRPAWLIIARREFIERVRTKWFAIVTLLGPIGLTALIVIPAWLAARSAQTEVAIHIVDQSPQKLGAAIADVMTNPAMGKYRAQVVAPDTADDELLSRIRDEKIDGYLRVPADALSGGTVIYRGSNASNLAFIAVLQQIVSRGAQTLRAAEAGIPPDELAALLTPVPMDAKHTTGSQEASSGEASFVIGYAVMFLLYMAIVLYCTNVLRSVVQEKTSRVVELMVSAVKPRALLLGKILGVGAVGLLQLAIWAVLALLLLRHREMVLGWFGVTGGGDVAFPSLSVIDIAVILGYFLFGYFFYAAIYAAIGAMVNSDQEAQQVQTPVIMLLIIPVLCTQLVASDPRGGAAEILTLVPLSSPILMPMRYLLGGASAADVALSLALLLAALSAAVFAAARIYRVGILMYGKRPGLRELARWLRHE